MIRYHARWVLPVSSPAVRDGTVVVDGERIAWVGPRAEAPPGRDEDLGDAVIMPGLVNAHIHLDLAAFEGAIEPRSFFPWVQTLVRTLAAVADAESLAHASHATVADQLAHGVTTLAHTGPSRVAFDAMRALGARGIAYFETFGPDPAQCDASIADLRKRVESAARDATPLVRVGVSPHAPYSVSDALYSATAAFARAESLPVAVHIAESPAETELVTRGDGEFASLLRGRGIAVAARAASPVALLENTGVLATQPLCIHVVQTDAEDARRMANSGATVAHCPRANAWFGYGRAPIAGLRHAGVTVGVGTDSIASNTELRLLREAAAAADAALSTRDRIRLATLDGARALRLERHIGSLDIGKTADLAAFAIQDTAACDVDPESYLLQRCAGDASVLTLVAGHVRARSGRAVALDEAALAALATARTRVREALATPRSP